MNKTGWRTFSASCSSRPLNNFVGTPEFHWSVRLGLQEYTTQDAQKGCPARPQRVKDRGVPLGYVEGLNDARTKLAEFFSILL
jgi:hypothetical protein